MCTEQVTQDARAELPAADALTEGGDSPSEQRCTFLELALALAGALDTSAIAMLYKAVKPALQVCFFPCGPKQWEQSSCPSQPHRILSMALCRGVSRARLIGVWA